jgi:hypothetical protein
MTGVRAIVMGVTGALPILGLGAYAVASASRSVGHSDRLFSSVCDEGKHVCVNESAEIDVRGRLHRAELRLTKNGMIEQQVCLNAQDGTVEIRERGTTARWHVPTELPWSWLPLWAVDPASRQESPVSAVVTLRGAEQHEALTVIDLKSRSHHSVMADQLVSIADERSAWVVVGDEAVQLPRHDNGQ